MLKRLFCFTLACVVTVVSCFVFTSCKDQKEDKVSPIYRTESEWKERYTVSSYGENKELSSVPDGRPHAKCYNGTFVGNLQEDVKVWKGVPFAKQPVGELRFAKPLSPDKSDKIFDASYFGKSCVQSFDDKELSSQYEQGEDCLYLNVWNSVKNDDSKKPVFVFIHGGGWISGGTSDPLYDGWNFAHYNPDVIVVTVTYRFGVMGLVDLSDFDSNGDFSASANNAILDQIQALKWINENISAFGGDPENVTVCGESAGAGAVSVLCTISTARKYFSKAIPMSGGCNQVNTVEQTKTLPLAIKEEFPNATSVKDLQNIPFNEIKAWWEKDCELIYNNVVADGNIIPEDPYKVWASDEMKAITVLQGHTSNEFEYYLYLFDFDNEFYDTLCQVNVDMVSENANADYLTAFGEYKRLLTEQGLVTAKQINREFMNDYVLSATNEYQAYLHSEAGGSEFCYVFDKKYDGELSSVGAAHAVDCYYLFGNFDGDSGAGTNDEVDLSIAFQKMIANFCKTGDPSTDSLKWEKYDIETGYKMIIDDEIRLEKGFQLEKNKAVIKMIESNPLFKYVFNFGETLPIVYDMLYK